MVGRLKVSTALAAGLCMLCVFQGSAAAAPVTIGQVPPAPALQECASNAFDLLQPTVTSGNSYVVPVGGVVVTSWSTTATNATGQMLKMKIFRPAGGTNYTVVGHDTRALTPSIVNTFPTRILVHAGDVLGDTIVQGAAPGACDFPVTGDSHPERMGDLADGSTGNFPGPGSANLRVNIAAVLRFLPAITSVAPASGGPGGGSAVTITGHDLSAASAVSFGGVPASSYTVNSDSSITAISPAEPPGAVDVRVTTPAGQTAISSADRFTFATPAVKKCVVPKLKGKKLKKARKLLKKAHCKVGKVRGKHRKHGRVKKQKPKPGKILPAGSKVNLKF